jgi:hypothetical protein
MISKDYIVGGMNGHLETAAPDRYARVPKYGLELEAFTVCAGDEWNPGVKNGDKSKFSERTEFRSETIDMVGDGKRYRYAIPVLVELDYPVFSPKQCFAQWHEGEYPIASLRYENGVMQFIVNYKSGWNVHTPIPFTKGRLNTVFVALQFNPGEDAGSAYVHVDGLNVVRLPKVSLVEVGTKSVYFKYGVYRSGMNDYKVPRPAPAHTVLFGQVRREVVDNIGIPMQIGALKPVVPAKPPLVTPPIATIPAPVIPTPSAPAASLYARIAALSVSILSLEPDMSPKYAASIGFLGQAVDKLAKMTARMQKVDAKAK